jgi:hypothetical protein
MPTKTTKRFLVEAKDAVIGAKPLYCANLNANLCGNAMLRLNTEFVDWIVVKLIPEYDRFGFSAVECEGRA